MEIIRHTFHDLLNLHFQGDDLTDSRLVGVGKIAPDAMDAEGSTLDGSHVVIFEEYHLVGMLDDSAVHVRLRLLCGNS